ncbi:MAG TPA: histidine kinase dimerization/phospho-acceptor domain-containing protein, partial [Alphaproteobacteria bacterium]|nr:histidine kinase dimerization/phospho-acceptor domain-containing protein [Alphaproteobacteria bacterium]
MTVLAEHAMQELREPALIALSFVVASIAAYAALDLGERLAAADRRVRLAWLTAFGLAVGGGAWSLHFIAMLTWDLSARVAYDTALTLLSFLLVVGGTMLGLLIALRRGRATLDLAWGGLMMGLGIVAAYYTVIMAMQAGEGYAFDARRFVIALLTAIVVASVMLRLSLLTPAGWRKPVIAAGIGGAFLGIHYMTMTAARFHPAVAPPEDAIGVAHGTMAIWAAAVAGILFATALIVTAIDRRFARHLAYERELRAARDAADHASQAKNVFLAVVSHELRTPLNAIIGFAELMSHEAFGPLGSPRYREYAGHIRESGELLLAMINDLLDLTRAEAGKLDLVEETFDLAALLEWSRGLLEVRAKSGNVDLVCRIEEGLPKLFGDPRRVKQMVLNLIANAVKFTPAGGRIVVAAHHTADGGVAIAVADNG